MKNNKKEEKERQKDKDKTTFKKGMISHESQNKRFCAKSSCYSKENVIVFIHNHLLQLTTKLIILST